jgi:hypothetical protein
MSEQHAEYAQNKNWSGRGTLENLVQELNRQKESRVDFVTDTRSLMVKESNGGIRLEPKDTKAGEWLGSAGLPFIDQALEQFGSKCEPNVPSKFLFEMAAQRPGILADTLDALLRATPNRRFVRCLDGKVRAFLSDRYRVLDNYDIAFAALDAVRAAGGEVMEAALSDSHMRIKFTSRQVWDKVNVTRTGEKGNWYSGGLGNQEYLSKVAARRGDDLPGGPGTVHPLVTISNSETGHGGFNVRIGILQAICFNLATVEDVVGKVHLGERLSVGIFSEQTLNQESKAIYMKARDAVGAAFNKETFKKIVAMANLAQSETVTMPQAAVENVAKIASLSDVSRDALLGYFIKDYDVTRYGLAQATARLAQDEKSGDRASDLESLAGKIMKGEVALVGAKK